MIELYQAIGLVVFWVVISFLLFAIWGDLFWAIKDRFKR